MVRVEVKAMVRVMETIMINTTQNPNTNPPNQKLQTAAARNNSRKNYVATNSLVMPVKKFNGPD